MIRPSVRPNLAATVLVGLEHPRSLLAKATSELGGFTPSYYLDFINNRAIANSVDVGTISQIPSITGTLDLTARGHLVDGADNGLVIPLTGVTYPLTFYVEFVRTVNSGANEYVAGVGFDSGSGVYYRVDTASQVRWRIDTASALQCNVGGGSTIGSVPSAVQRAAGRAATNDAQNCRNGTLGTQDTAVTLPVSPVELRIGADFAGAQSFTGYISKIAIVGSAVNDAGLAKMVQPNL